VKTPFKNGLIGELKKGMSMTYVTYTFTSDTITINRKTLSYEHMSEFLKNATNIDYAHIFLNTLIVVEGGYNGFYVSEYYDHVYNQATVQKFLKLLERELIEYSHKISEVYAYRPSPKMTFSNIIFSVKTSPFSYTTIPIITTDLKIISYLFEKSKEFEYDIDHVIDRQSFITSFTSYIISGDELVSGEGIYTKFVVDSDVRVAVVGCDDSNIIDTIKQELAITNGSPITRMYINKKTGSVGAVGWLDLEWFEILIKRDKILRILTTSPVHLKQVMVIANNLKEYIETVL